MHSSFGQSNKQMVNYWPYTAITKHGCFAGAQMGFDRCWTAPPAVELVGWACFDARAEKEFEPNTGWSR